MTRHLLESVRGALICFFTEEKETYSSSSKEVTALYCLKDVGSQIGLVGQMGLGQRLLHSLDLHQTQRPLVPCSTRIQTLHRS